ncbi:hypothetical protein DE146DRAFT_475715 [Phaeosphaeria sp. MPI-PUGE-AT-0046c]|nr:hypothetical protein DE146DRAFT_475715 [Phaeosphaeria sp. MPI-PUGE-AT-0046c]
MYMRRAGAILTLLRLEKVQSSYTSKEQTCSTHNDNKTLTAVKQVRYGSAGYWECAELNSALFVVIVRDHGSNMFNAVTSRVQSRFNRKSWK